MRFCILLAELCFKIRFSLKAYYCIRILENVPVPMNIYVKDNYHRTQVFYLFIYAACSPRMILPAPALFFFNSFNFVPLFCSNTCTWLDYSYHLMFLLILLSVLKGGGQFCSPKIKFFSPTWYLPLLTSLSLSLPLTQIMTLTLSLTPTYTLLLSLTLTSTLNLHLKQKQTKNKNKTKQNKTKQKKMSMTCALIIVNTSLKLSYWSKRQSNKNSLVYWNFNTFF